MTAPPPLARSRIPPATQAKSETNTQVLEDLPDSDFDLSDDILASIPMPESTISYNENNICTNSVFNNCTINFVVKK